MFPVQEGRLSALETQPHEQRGADPWFNTASICGSQLAQSLTVDRSVNAL